MVRRDIGIGYFDCECELLLIVAGSLLLLLADSRTSFARQTAQYYETKQMRHDARFYHIHGDGNRRGIQTSPYFESTILVVDCYTTDDIYLSLLNSVTRDSRLLLLYVHLAPLIPKTQIPRFR